MKAERCLRMIVGAMVALWSVAAEGRVVRNPAFEARKASVLTVEEIDLGPDATRVKFHAVFRPNWWISVDSAECISDPATGLMYYPTGSEGITLGEKYWMPESGDTVFTVIYPALPENIEAIDFCPDGGWATWGIRLDGKETEGNRQSPMPEQAEGQYIGQPSFFKGGSVRLHGAIQNYDPRLDLDNLALYLNDLPTGDAYVKSVAVNDDGTFDETFDITSPQTTMISIGSALIIIYLEPDNDLQILTDWEKIMASDRMRGLIPKVEDVKFGGSLGEINRVLYMSPNWESGEMANLAKTADPLAVMEDVDSRIAGYSAEMEEYVNEHGLSASMRGFLDRRVQALRAEDFLNYLMYRRHFKDAEPENELYSSPIPKDFYDSFLPDLFKADTVQLGADMMWVVLNRLGFGTMEDVLDIHSDPLSGVSLYESAEMAEAVRKYADCEDVPFMWQIAMTARNGGSIKRNARWHKADYRRLIDSLQTNVVKDPYLAGRLDSLYASTVNLIPYELPDSEGGRIMRELLEPMKGKWVIADFWATTCGPCRANIIKTKAFRDANRSSKDFGYLFVTGDMESPRADYETFVQQNLTDDNCAYLKGTDIISVRDLFGISAIPHYVLFDPEGRVYDPSFSIYQTPAFLQQTGIEFVTPESTAQGE